MKNKELIIVVFSVILMFFAGAGIGFWLGVDSVTPFYDGCLNALKICRGW